MRKKLISLFLILCLVLGTPYFGAAKKATAEEEKKEGLKVGAPDVEHYVAEVDPETGYTVYYPVDDKGNRIEENYSVPQKRGTKAATSIPAKFDPRTLENSYLPPVRDQNPTGTCWAHTTLSLIEINLRKKAREGLITIPDGIDLSESHLVYFTGTELTDTHNVYYGDRIYNKNFQPYSQVAELYARGGNLGMALETIAAGMGPISERSGYSVQATPAWPENDRFGYEYQVNSFQHYSLSDKNAVKQAILNDGAVGLSFFYDNMYMKYSTKAYYNYNGTEAINHAVTIVGWDDNYSASNFAVTPAGNGAWIIRNSWGSGWSYGEGGYFYLSYYCGSVSDQDVISLDASLKDGLTTQARTSYSNYAIYGFNSYGYGISGGTIFTAEQDLVIKAIGLESKLSSMPYRYYVYKGVPADNPAGGTLIDSGSGTFPYVGMYRIELDSDTLIEEGERYSVVVDFTDSTAKLSTDAYSVTGGSFMRACNRTIGEYSSWQAATYDGRNVDLFLKAYTADPPHEHKDLNSDGYCDDCDEIIDGICAAMGYGGEISNGVGMRVYLDLGEKITQESINNNEWHISVTNTCQDVTEVFVLGRDTETFTSSNKKKYQTFLIHMAAKEMKDMYEIRVYNTYTGLQSIIFSCNFATYLDEIDHEFAMDPDRWMAQALRYYCNCAKVYFNYDTTNLYDWVVPENFDATIDAFKARYYPMLRDEEYSEDFHFDGYSMVLTDKPMLATYFALDYYDDTLPQPDVDFGGFVYLTDSMGWNARDLSPELQPEFINVNGNWYYKIYSPMIPIAECALEDRGVYAFYLESYYGTVTVYMLPLDYIYQVLASGVYAEDSELYRLCGAFYYFSKLASTYNY